MPPRLLLLRSRQFLIPPISHQSCFFHVDQLLKAEGSTNHYKTLGLDSSATPAEVKKLITLITTEMIRRPRNVSSKYPKPMQSWGTPRNVKGTIARLDGQQLQDPRTGFLAAPIRALLLMAPALPVV
ncbi:MAG: hypothetical protein Q9223_000003 [Gallowayella weberi]